MWTLNIYYYDFVLYISKILLLELMCPLHQRYQNGEGPLYSRSEADEYDRSFLMLNPSWAAITSTDSDHLDIYGDASKVLESFADFAEKVVDPDCLIVAKNKVENITTLTYSATDSQAYYHAEILERTNRGTSFNLRTRDELLIENLFLNIPGNHNVENAIAASVLALKAGVSAQTIKQALGQFKGIKRRFEFVLSTEEIAFIMTMLITHLRLTL